MSIEEARGFFLARIQKQLAEEGRPLTDFESRYWKALAPRDESEVQALWKQKSLQSDLDAAEKRFQDALHEAIKHDLIVSSTARTRYLGALEEIKSLDGVQLQAIVFAAANDFEELTPSSLLRQCVIVAAILILLSIGVYLGMHLRK